MNSIDRLLLVVILQSFGHMVAGFSILGSTKDECFCTCADGKQCILAAVAVFDPLNTSNNRICKCDSNSGTCPQEFEFSGTYPCNPSFTVPEFLRNLLYPTNYGDNIYSNYDINNIISSLNSFIHGDTSGK